MGKVTGIGIGIFGLALGAGCLSEGRRAGDTGTGDTGSGDTGSGDTGAGDTGTADTSGRDADTRGDGEVVTCGSCDDGDPCTYDRCIPETGECEHLGVPSGEPGASGDAAVPVLHECDGDHDCDDGDACTTNRCVTLEGYCGMGGATVCEYEPVPGCSHGCNSTGKCDDRDPCTEDVCGVDGSCSYAPLEGCVSACTKDGLMSLRDAMGSAFEARVKTVGALGPSSVGGACDDGPRCNCQMGASAFADDLELRLMPDMYWHPNWAGESVIQSACETSGCVDKTVGCNPLVEGVVFRVWGRPLAGGLPNGIAIMPRVDALELEGFCLDTEPMSLEGQYQGRLEVVPGTAVTFAVTMVAVDQGVIVEIGRAECAVDDCPPFAVPDGFAQGTVIEEGDGQIGFHFVAPAMGGMVSAHARLFSNEGRFVGRWAPYVGPFPTGDVALPAGGTIELVRLGTGRLPELGARP